MVVCDYIRIFLVKDEDGKEQEVRDKCNSKFNAREIEFKHAEYREQNRICFLCETHFMEVFGDIDEEEKKAMRDWRNARISYNRDYTTAKKQAEYFDEQNFKEHTYPKVQKLYDRWNQIRKKVCRYEGCDIELSTIRRVFVIRTYSQKGTEWSNYYICCKDHWMKFMYRVGIERIKKEEVKAKVRTLDEYR